MSCVLELTAVREEVVCVHSESIKDKLSPLYQPAYDLLLGFHDVKGHIVFLCVFVYVCIYINIYIYIYTYIQGVLCLNVQNNLKV
jgi:hypothetical protein